ATPVVLLDDITAELDERAIEILLSTLAKLPCQVFMSSLTADITPLVNDLWSNPMMFHVKQGQVLPF
ncbi:MAG: DNA replication/repair protein RecF, partial [Psychrobacter celer]